MERKRPDHRSTQTRSRKVLHHDCKIQSIEDAKILIDEKFNYKAKANDIEQELMRRNANGETI